jgi:hypothetical protein
MCGNKHRVPLFQVVDSLLLEYVEFERVLENTWQEGLIKCDSNRLLCEPYPGRVRGSFSKAR